MNKRYLEEVKELEARWNKDGLLDGIKDRYSRKVTAVLLESQRLWNEQIDWNPGPSRNNYWLKDIPITPKIIYDET